MQPHDERAEVRRIGAQEFLDLLVSRRSLERLHFFPRHAQGRSRGLRDRTTGTVYVWIEEPSVAPAAAVGGTAG